MCGCAPPTTSSGAPRPTAAASRWSRSPTSRATCSLQTPSAARVRLTQLEPKPYALERTDALPVISRLPRRDHADMRSRSGSRTGSISARGAGLRGGRSPAVTEAHRLESSAGGLRTAQALAAADNAAGGLTVKVVRAAQPMQRGRCLVARAGPGKGLPLGEAANLRLPQRQDRSRRRSTCRSRSRNDMAQRSKSRSSAPPARCSCSTSAGVAAPWA